jgi:hypothetical protein
MDRAREALRGAYRTHWNLPGIRRALAHGSHLMVRGAADVGELLVGGGGGGGPLRDEGEGARAPLGVERARLVELVEQVFREYQRQLWDPLSGASANSGTSTSGASANSGTSTFLNSSCFLP